MKTLTLNMPAMYADHHVLRVREVLAGLAGIALVVASSARKKVVVDYDESVLSPEGIAAALTGAGYSPDQELQLLNAPEQSKDGSAWYTVLHRVTRTEMKDREMSGDFRRY